MNDVSLQKIPYSLDGFFTMTSPFENTILKRERDLSCLRLQDSLEHLTVKDIRLLH